MTAPLEGIRVADFTWVWAGPFCTLQLAHLGAEVIRVESTTRTCVTRLLPPFAEGKPGINRSGYFNQYNQGKLSLGLDLKQPEALAVAKDLIAHSDVLCENFATGVMERMGLGYEEVRRAKPDIIMIALSGYGATGPEREFVSYGPAQVPLSGMSSVTGYADWPPMHVGISYGDPTGGLHGAVAVLGEALLEQSMTGRQPPRTGNRVPHMAPHGVFRCAGEQRWVAIAVRDDDDWRRCAAEMDHVELADDARFATLAARKTNEDALEALVSAWTAPQAAEEVAERLQRAGVPACVSMHSKDIAEDPHLAASGFFVHLPHPEVGTRLHLGVSDIRHGTPPPASASTPTRCWNASSATARSRSPRCARAAFLPKRVDRLRASSRRIPSP